MKDKLNLNTISFFMAILCLGLFSAILSSRNLVVYMNSHYHMHPFTPILILTLITFVVLGVLSFSGRNGSKPFFRSLITIMLTVGFDFDNNHHRWPDF